MSFLSDPPLHDFPDRALRRLLEHRHNLRDLLRLNAPDLAEHFDFERAELLDRSFLLENWRGREADLLFRIPFHAGDGEEPVLVCVLLEHQSKPDPRMPLRMLLYAVLYWERQWKEWENKHEHGETLHLSPVLPIVFHTGSQRWSGKRSMADLISGPDLLRPFMPVWNVLFWDLAERTPQELLAAAGEFVQALAVVRVGDSDRETFQQVYADVVTRLEPLGALDKIRWSDLLYFLLSWGVQRRPKSDFGGLRDLAVTSQSDVTRRKEIDAMSQTLEKSWAQEKFEEGELYGALKATRASLRLFLENQFGPLPKELLQRIESVSDLERLQNAVRSALTIERLDQLQL
jgi:hypothetical protein